MATRADVVALLFVQPPLSTKTMAGQLGTTSGEVRTVLETIAELGLVEHDAATDTWNRTELAEASPEAFAFVVLEAGGDLSLELSRVSLLN